MKSVSSIRSGTSHRCGTTRTNAHNQINARRQQVQILFAKAAQAAAWFDRKPEDSAGGRATVDGRHFQLAVYRFAIEDLYRQQGTRARRQVVEHLLSLASRFESTPNDAYAALSTLRTPSFQP